jgi:hypothetical protein
MIETCTGLAEITASRNAMAGLRNPDQLRPAMAHISACRKISADGLTKFHETENI